MMGLVSPRFPCWGPTGSRGSDAGLASTWFLVWELEMPYLLGVLGGCGWDGCAVPSPPWPMVGIQ